MRTNDEMVKLLAQTRMEISALKLQAAQLPPEDAAMFLATLDQLSEKSQEIARSIGR